MSVVLRVRGAVIGCVGVALALVGCTGAPATTQGESATTTTGEATASATSTSTTSTDGMSSTSAATTTTTTTTATTSTTTSSTTAEESTGCTFLCPTDLGSECNGSFCCNPWLQDCPEGEKCNAWENDGGGAWNANKCVPVDPDPDAVGEPCTVVENGVSGLDSCDYGAMCWSVDPDTNTGTCVGLCQGRPEQCTMNPTSCCPPWAACTIAGGGNLILCLATCHPLIQNCQGQGDFCYLAEDWSLCVPDASGDTGEPGDPCEAMNACDPGTYCGDPKTYPGCDLMADGCCIPFCDLLAPACAPGSVCQPYFEINDTPAGFEDLGACVIP